MIKGKHIKQLIVDKLPQFKGHIYPLETTETSENSIYYDISPVSGGYVNQVRVKINIVGKDFDELEEISDIIVDLFDTKENAPTPVIDGLAFRGSLSGGGVLFLDGLALYNFSRIFVLKTKE